MSDAKSISAIQYDVNGFPSGAFVVSGVDPLASRFNPDPSKLQPCLLAVAAFGYGNGGTDGLRPTRVAAAFPGPTTITTNVATPVWGPTGGNRLVLMGFTVSVCGTLAAPGPLEIALSEEGGAAIWSGLAFCNDTFLGDTQLGADFGNGRRFEDVDTDLIVTLSDNLVSGAVIITPWGIEEVG